MIKSIVETIDHTGDARNKLGFALGPIAFDHTDPEVIELIRDGFSIAMELNVAVAFHLDDSMYWGRRNDLLRDSNNVEWLDWRGTPNTGRRQDWGPRPNKLKPQMCFNSPAIISAVKQRAELIGREVARGVQVLKVSGRPELYAGFMAGWETHIGRDFATGDYLGYCALTNMGFSANRPPKDINYQRTRLVKNFIQMWARELTKGGVPKDKLYSHIVFTGQGLDDEKRVAKASFEERFHFATPEVAFDESYRPGFSTYPAPGVFTDIYEQLNRYGNPPWASAEGTNIFPSGFPGERTMETYLGRMFNHGAVLVNIFSWGMGGEALQGKNMFRIVTESTEAIAAYRKFLAGKRLIEDPQSPLSMTAFQTQIGELRKKLKIIEQKLPSWVRATRKRDQAEAIMKRLDKFIADGNPQEANRTADEILGLIDAN